MKKLAAFLFLGFILFVILAADQGTIPPFLRAFYRFPGGDLAGHFFLYGILTYLLARAFPRRLQMGGFSPAISSLWVFGLALAEELSQFFFPLRTPDLLDLACGLLGILLADCLAFRRLSGCGQKIS